MLAIDSRTTHVALSTNPACEIVSWNDGCHALFGIADDIALGQPLQNMLAVQCCPAFAASIANLPSRGHAQDVLILCSDGSTRMAELVLIAQYDASGAYAGNIAFFTAEPDDSEASVVGRMPLSSIIDVLPGTFYVIRPDGTFALWNKMLEQVSAMTSEEVAACNALDMYDLAEKRVIANKIIEVFEHGTPAMVEANYRDKYGHGTPYLLCGALIECHGRRYLCGMGLDISQRRDQEERLRLHERALHATSNGLVITRCAGGENPIEYVNPAFERITGYCAEEVIGHDMRFMTATGSDESERDQLRRAIRERREVNVVFRNRRKNGEIFWNDLTITPVSDGHGKVSHFIGVINDVTAIKQRTAHLEHEVNHDALTGLANRTLLWDRLEQAIHMAQRNKSMVATVLLDLNGFKKINDTHGHQAGDEVLKVVAQRLQASVREGDTVARLSGDEFVLVLVNQPSPRYTMRMLERLRAGMAKPVIICNTEIAVAGSMGVSVFPHDGASALELVRAADAAMYHAKSSKTGQLHFFSADMQSSTRARQKMEDDMHLALERNELFLLFQPKVCVRSGRIHGLEALLRWRHPELGVMLPASFLAEAEDNGMIVAFGVHVLEQACALMQRMERNGAAPLPVAVNVSYCEFSRHHFTDRVAEILAKCGIAPHQLELELREESLNHNHHLGIEVLSQLRDMGVQRSVDAFGSGMCDLNFLQKLPLTHLNLAKRAVHQITAEARSGVVCKALIDVAHDLGVKVIAKGVETRVQLDFLRHNDCDELQGTVFAGPLEEHALLELLATSAPG